MTKPPRKFFVFQFHLSTAIVMMFVAGALIWANSPKTYYPTGDPNDGHFVMVLGWPKPGFVTSDAPVFQTYHSEFHFLMARSLVYILYLNFMIDLTVATAILFAVWYFLERLIRRRAAQKEA
ncbi:MAG: hypothetical protein WCT04_21505 [Planctomycetota bacterium]